MLHASEVQEPVDGTTTAESPDEGQTGGDDGEGSGE